MTLPDREVRKKGEITMKPLLDRISPPAPSFADQLRMAQSSDVFERRAVASQSVYRAILEFSVTDRDAETRGRAASNPALPQDLREGLTHDRDAWVALRAVAATHPTEAEWHRAVAQRGR
jgi:hypothetical protein